MGIFQVSHTGSFKFIDAFLAAMRKEEYILNALNRYGQAGIAALASFTPVDTGYTAGSWYYSIHQDGKSYSIVWSNSNEINGTPLVVMLQYGHGTGTGGYVEGQDFINPAIRPIFEQIAEDVWREVTSA